MFVGAKLRMYRDDACSVRAGVGCRVGGEAVRLLAFQVCVHAAWNESCALSGKVYKGFRMILRSCLFFA